VRNGTLLASEYRALRHGHGEALLPMIERVMQQAGLAPSQLDAIAAAIGPGGFTGIRVGLAAAHGIALAAGARLVGISSFAAVAAGVAAIGDADCQTLLVALDSRRADLYVQLFARDATTPLAAPQALLGERLAGYVARHAGNGRVLIAGDAAAAAAAALGSEIRCVIDGESVPNARAVAAAALRQLGSGAMAGPVRPFYLRPPDVTLPTRSLATRSRPPPASLQ
jgi:tRNA threonylcarbamoyladenosine biosynthesis protein TsaB